MAVKMEPQKVYIAASVASLVVTAAVLFYCLAISNTCAVSTFFFTADQQGQRHYRQKNYEKAARQFTDPLWRATAFFRAGDFKQAAQIFSGAGAAEGAFNHGNALVMLGQYGDAIKSYDRALAQKPGWEAAQINRGIAVARAEMVKREGGDMTGGEMGADDFVFDQSKGKSQAQETVEDVEHAEFYKNIFLTTKHTKYTKNKDKNIILSKRFTPRHSH